MIGHAAWQGYGDSGAGMLFCELASPVPLELDWRYQSVTFSRQYLGRDQVAARLRRHGLGPEAINPSLDALNTYDPAREVVVMLCGHGCELIALLRNLRTAPPACFEQVERRWSEFACAMHS
ncbi:hypothetical protein KQ302_07170 [Synechococcus sp. CS-602]|uniref:hypothetical protein n=1 Tax=Synechococcaceae TaxID=1890426 RepID=UPI0009F88B76|nr:MULTISPECIES: hypothetical protein [Synechococcaceae]MCT4364019.1 hypothetical protein [Candidatus Regnicoccus frigidus MAG-AL1]MCT0204882.1 hypothetical protein [Synechococcus sp. CS-602]MCT0245839.1 hypothetical protein [Synechococcus sp. CS-601]MCT4368732.1 hypothetical protein [Candidatus Regnicoccus frigidus MAG-AL2]TWB87901.1 hypothetical protein FB106_11929 [Synechococcus sp. Ace-Pa]